MTTELMISENRDAANTGILFQIFNRERTKASLEELWLGAKESAVAYIKEHPNNSEIDAPFLSIKMPCGAKFELKTFGEVINLPIKDIPCPCGNPNHWFIRYIYIQE